MLVFGLPGAFIGGIVTSYVGEIILWQIFYLNSITIKFKLQMQLENNRLKYIRLKPSNRLLAISLRSVLTRLHRVHSSIIENNKFCSKFLFIQISGFGLIFAKIVAQLTDDLDIYSLVFFIYIITAIIISGMTTVSGTRGGGFGGGVCKICLGGFWGVNIASFFKK